MRTWQALLLTLAVPLIASAAAQARPPVREVLDLLEPFIAEGDAESALSLLADSIAEDPTGSGYYVARGMILSDLDDTEGMTEAFATAYELGDLEARALSFIAVFHITIGDAETAYLIANEAIATDPEDYSGYGVRGTLLGGIGEFDLAKQDFLTVVRLEPDHAYAYASLGTICSLQEEYEEAVSYLDIAIELRPDSVELYCLRGNLYIALEEYEPALLDLDRAIEIDPANWNAYLSRSVANRKLGRLGAGLADLNAVLDANPGWDETYYQRGTLYAELGEYESARADFETVLEITEHQELRESTEQALAELPD